MKGRSVMMVPFISVVLVVLLISLNFVLLHDQQQAKAQSLMNKILDAFRGKAGQHGLNQTKILRTYTNASYGVTMNYLTNWTYNQGNPILKSVRQNVSSAQNASSTLRTLHFLAYFYPTNLGLENGSFVPPALTLAVVDNVEKFSLPQYVNKILNQQNKTTFHLESKNSTMLGGHLAEKLVYDSTDNEDRPTKTMNVVATNGKEIYLFLFYSSPKDYPTYLRPVEDMRNSLVIK